MKLRDALLHASLVAASACECPDGLVETAGYATYKLHRAEINACIASDQQCEALCRAALELDMNEAVAIPKCVITSTSMEGVALDVQYLEPIDCGIGRKPACFTAPLRRTGIGAWLSSVATLEAASVTAFARLVRSLARFDAPAKLVEAARRAIADELAHAGAVGRLARRFGGMPEAPVVATSKEQTLDQLAIENAIEGEVGETFGALVAACQSRAAQDPGVRLVFGKIAIDEARHAALAHQLAPWFERRLGLQQRNAVAAARQAAIARAVATCDFGLASHEREVLGIPEPARLRSAARELFASIG